MSDTAMTVGGGASLVGAFASKQVFDNYKTLLIDHQAFPKAVRGGATGPNPVEYYYTGSFLKHEVPEGATSWSRHPSFNAADLASLREGAQSRLVKRNLAAAATLGAAALGVALIAKGTGVVD